MLCKVTLGVLKGASKLNVLLLGVKQLCCETTYCFRTNSYYYYYYAAIGVNGSP